MKTHSLFFLVALTSMLALFLTGCESPQEKKGISPLPQNAPQSWETRPYGDLKN